MLLRREAESLIILSQRPRDGGNLEVGSALVVERHHHSEDLRPFPDVPGKTRQQDRQALLGADGAADLIEQQEAVPPAGLALARQRPLHDLGDEPREGGRHLQVGGAHVERPAAAIGEQQADRPVGPAQWRTEHRGLTAPPHMAHATARRSRRGDGAQHRLPPAHHAPPEGTVLERHTLRVRGRGHAAVARQPAQTLQPVQEPDLGPPESHGPRELAQHPGGDFGRLPPRRPEQGETIEGAHLPHAADATREQVPTPIVSARRRQRPLRARRPACAVGSESDLLHRQIGMCLNVEHARLILATGKVRVNRIYIARTPRRFGPPPCRPRGESAGRAGRAVAGSAGPPPRSSSRRCPREHSFRVRG